MRNLFASKFKFFRLDGVRTFRAELNEGGVDDERCGLNHRLEGIGGTEKLIRNGEVGIIRSQRTETGSDDNSEHLRQREPDELRLVHDAFDGRRISDSSEIARSEPVDNVGIDKLQKRGVTRAAGRRRRRRR